MRRHGAQKGVKVQLFVLTSALDKGGSSTPRLDRFTPGRSPSAYLRPYFYKSNTI